MPQFHDLYHESSTWNHNLPVCPYCGVEFQIDDFPRGDESEIETECPRCEKPIRVHTRMSFSFRAMKADKDTFKFTLRHWEKRSRRLVYGTNSCSRMVVGVICQWRRPWMPKDHQYAATTYWSDDGYESFTTLGEARKWLEDSFRDQVLGEVGR
jgi:hypothetical protein